ncbi:dihydroorotase [Desulfocucumis palustris]|uniref:Dihydroorotase n=1 Tax=Desulfocucumis palustris TaxID=1898651 RepID=A0A2L2X814_9FIRM|nr:amidohydrolase family protein [Desulfocucumis palustris]GBF32054.1 dihydroorotase [Desulfocucumis palustris]
MKILGLTTGKHIIVKAGSLFDGTGSRVRDRVDIYIEGQRVYSIEPNRKGGESPGASPADFDRLNPSGRTNDGPRHMEVVDLSHCTLLPGLVDCHVHLALDGRDFNDSLARWENRAEFTELVNENLSGALAKGIAGVRDGGDLKGLTLRHRNEIARGNFPGPHIKCSGWAIGKKGKYGSFLGPGYIPCQLPDSIRRLAASGADQIKVLVSGVVSFSCYGRVGELQFSQGELNNIVDLAREYGLPVMAHASSEQAVKLAVRAGVNSVEHGYFISRASLEEMAEKGISWIPTLVPVANQVKGDRRKSYSPEQIEIIENTYRRQQKMLAMAVEMGVPLGVGTDAGAGGVPHGAGYLEEMMLYREAGLSEEVILKAATSAGAAISGFREIGRIEPGNKAFMIAVRGNPLEDLNCLKEIEYLFLPRG